MTRNREGERVRGSIRNYQGGGERCGGGKRAPGKEKPGDFTSVA